MKLILTIVGLLYVVSSIGQVNLNELKRNKNGRWTKIGEKKPYNGDFIEYFPSGTLLGKGTFKNGLAEGFRVVFYENQDTSFYRNYIQGIANGYSKEFYLGHKIKQEGKFINDKEDGTWIFYFENGNKESVINYKNGIHDGDYMLYTNDGVLKAKYIFKNGKATYGKEIDELVQQVLTISKKAQNQREKEFNGKPVTISIGSQTTPLSKNPNIDKVIELYDKAIAINSTIPQLYFNRGTEKLNNFSFEEAIKDFDKAIELNPEYMAAYANRGTAKFNLIPTKVKLEHFIPETEQTKSVCDDFRKAKQLGDNSIDTEDMIYLFCGGLQKEKK